MQKNLSSEKRKKPLTINDIAKEAGVAKSTVSKVLNEQRGVSQETRRKVLKAVKKLNYHPSVIARSLKSKRTKAVGLILPNIINPFFPAILKGVEDTAIENGYVVVFCDSDDRKEKESLYFQIFENRWVDGIIFSGITGDKQEEKYIRSIHEKGTPVVLIDREIEDYFTNVVMIDNKRAGFDATSYLLKLGHRKIGCITGPQNIKIFVKRLEGYRRALEKYNVDFNPDLVEEGDLSIESGRSATKKLLKKKITFTAIFASTDLMAIGCIRELQENGIKIPSDVSVIGIDNIPLASLVTPSLTTIAQPAYEMGVEAMNLLIKNIEKRGVLKSKIILPTELVVRKSTKPVVKNKDLSVSYVQ